MSDTSVLMETIAAAMLDGATVSFAPHDADGTQLPTGLIVGVRHDGRGGRVIGNTSVLGFDELLASGAADKVLTEAIVDTMEPVIDAAIRDREHTAA
ncbi:MAG: hypothetical protein KY460_02665 [Actinobacteria bacterium]|nr:hypothetical protein [Actinomycetota bacterium]